MNSNTKEALIMLGRTLEVYNDGGRAINKAYPYGYEEVMTEYNLALKTIQRRYDELIKSMEDDE